jgi:hypothetical protein
MANLTPSQIKAAQAALVAKQTVGKRPPNAPAPTKIVKKSGTGLSPRERQEVSIKQPVQKIQSSTGRQTPGTVAEKAFTARQDQKAALQQSLRAPKGPTGGGVKQGAVSKTTPAGGTVTKAAPRVPDSRVTAGDVKDVVQQRSARQDKGPVRTNLRDSNAPSGIIKTREEQGAVERAAQQRVNAARVVEAQRLRNDANKQVAQSRPGSTVRPVSDPRQEPNMRREADARVTQGLKDIAAREVAVRRSGLSGVAGKLGGQHAGGQGAGLGSGELGGMSGIDLGGGGSNFNLK